MYLMNLIFFLIMFRNYPGITIDNLFLIIYSIYLAILNETHMKQISFEHLFLEPTLLKTHIFQSLVTIELEQTVEYDQFQCIHNILNFLMVCLSSVKKVQNVSKFWILSVFFKIKYEEKCFKARKWYWLVQELSQNMIKKTFWL